MNNQKKETIIFLVIAVLAVLITINLIGTDKKIKQNQEQINQIRIQIENDLIAQGQYIKELERFNEVIVEQYMWMQKLMQDGIKIEVEVEVTPPETKVKSVQTASMKTFEVTAYTAGYESTGKTPDHPEYGVTASGNDVIENYTIACGSSYDFGTQFYIPYFDRTYTCEDRGGAISDRHLDVYMPDLDEAKRFGRRQLEAQILE